MARGSQTRRRIESEALRLFVERGVAETAIRDIAQAAGIADGALYRHFPSKEALVGHLFVSNYVRFAEELDRLQTPAEGGRAKLAAMIGGFCRFFDADPLLFRFLLFVQHGQIARLDPDAPSPVDVVRRVLEGAMKRREMTHRDPALATAWVFGIVLQTATTSIYGRLSPKLTPFCDEIVDAAWRALAGAEPPQR